MKCHTSRTALVKFSRERSLSPVRELGIICAEVLASVHIQIAGLGKGLILRSGRGGLHSPWLHFT